VHQLDFNKEIFISRMHGANIYKKYITVFLGDYQRTVVMYTISYKENDGVP